MNNINKFLLPWTWRIGVVAWIGYLQYKVIVLEAWDSELLSIIVENTSRLEALAGAVETLAGISEMHSNQLVEFWGLFERTAAYLDTICAALPGVCP